jgi:hypothetical protein
MVREPGVAAESNATVAVLVNVPVDGRPIEELLAVVGRRTERLAQVYPILPLAPGAPIAVGALSWAGSLGIGLATDPASCDAEVLAARIELTLSLLEAPVIDGGDSRDRPHESQEESRA